MRQDEVADLGLLELEPGLTDGSDILDALAGGLDPGRRPIVSDRAIDVDVQEPVAGRDGVGDLVVTEGVAIGVSRRDLLDDLASPRVDDADVLVAAAVDGGRTAADRDHRDDCHHQQHEAADDAPVSVLHRISPLSSFVVRGAPGTHSSKAMTRVIIA